MAAFKIVHEAGAYVVRELHKSACTPCATAWRNGTLAGPGSGGAICTHGRGSWQVGQIGPRGGWYAMSPSYPAQRAAEMVCDALAAAALVPEQGVR
jgi:hypothetical protein